MRTFGLLFLLAGTLLLLAPKFFEMVHRYYRFDEGPILGGALICVGVAAIALTRSQA